MKCRVGMLLICITIMELAGCAFINPISASEGEPVVYQDLLSEYERVMKDTTYTEEQWGDNIYDYIKRCIGKTQLYYCITDLVGDGKPELILGTMREGEYEILGTVYEEGCEPFIIYTYDDIGAKWASISEEYIMTIYKDGIVELISGGVNTHFMYKQIEKDEVFEKTLDTIVCRQIKDEEPYYYKYKMENGKYVDGEYEELSEDEFYNIRNQYTAVKEELEWKPVEGFWDAGILEQNSTTSKEIAEIQESGGIIHESGLAEDTTFIENIESASRFESIVEVIENNNVAILTPKIKELLQNNLLEGFVFLESEKALCYYLKKEPSDMYVFAVCKEDLSGDIIHERDVYVAKETGRIYRKDEGTLIPLEINVPRGIRLPDVTRNVWNYEPELVYSEDGTSFQIIYGEEGADVLDQMLDFIEQEEGLENYKIMYYGECTFFDRRYHEVNLVESSDTHVHIVKRYYIDARNGNVYEEPEDWYMDSEIALHYVGNIGEAEEKTSKTAINIHDSFIQIETNNIHKRITFPSIDIADAEDVANSINEQIYHEIMPEDFLEYGHGREETEVQYEIESAGEEIVSIHFHGYQSYMGSYAEYNKGMNFDLRTGKIISLKDYYTLSDIKSIIMNARDRNEISILDFPVNEEEIEQEIDSFVQLFDSEEYVKRTDIFFLKDDHIYFIAPPPESMRQSIYMELSLDKFRKLQ